MNKIPSGRFSQINPIKAFYRTNFTKAGFNPVQVSEHVKLPHLSISDPNNMIIFSHLSQLKPALEKYAKAKGVLINIIAPKTEEEVRKGQSFLQRVLFPKNNKGMKHLNSNDLLFEITDISKKETEIVGFTTKKKKDLAHGIKSLRKSVFDTIEFGVGNLNGENKFESVNSVFNVSG